MAPLGLVYEANSCTKVTTGIIAVASAGMKTRVSMLLAIAYEIGKVSANLRARNFASAGCQSSYFKGPITAVQTCFESRHQFSARQQ